MKSALKPERIFLVGFMCSGKTRVGKEVAKRLGFDFIDLDSEIERKEGMNIPEIFEKKGEEYFRELELQVLKEISNREGVVISTGGGLGANHEAMSFMKERGTVVWLRVSFENFVKRCGSKKDRPLLARGRDYLKRLMEEREEVYSGAHIAVEDEGGIEAKVEKIISLLSSRSCQQ